MIKFVDAFINNFNKFVKYVSRNEEYHQIMKKFKWVFSQDVDNSLIKLPPLLIDDINKKKKKANASPQLSHSQAKSQQPQNRSENLDPTKNTDLSMSMNEETPLKKQPT